MKQSLFNRTIALALAAILAYTAPVSAQVNRVTALPIIDNAGAGFANAEGQLSTYSSTVVGLAPASSATDIACLRGSSTKTVKVTKIQVSGTAGTLVTLPVIVRKYSSLNTGGTIAFATTTIGTPYAYHSTQAAATAVPTYYTANPTVVDTTPGQIAAQTVSFNTTAALVVGPPAAFQWGESGGAKEPTLVAATEQICVNLNGISVSSGLLSILFEWTEF